MKITGVFQDTEGNLIKDKLMIISVMPFCKSEFVFNGHLKYRGEYFLGLTGAEMCDFLCLFRFKIKLTKLHMIFHRRTIVSQFTIVCILTKQFANSW